MKVSPLQDNFNGGEFSPLCHGRVTSDRYKAALAVCLNYIPTIQGGLARRVGTRFVAAVKNSLKRARFEKFKFSTTQAYGLEFGDQYIRFFRNNGQILETAKTITAATAANPVEITSAAHGFVNGNQVVISGVVGMTELNGKTFTVANAATDTFELSGVDGSAYAAYVSGGEVARIYEVASPYAEAHVFQMKSTQSADVLYITHNSYAPRKLTRTGHTSWTLSTIEFLDGPYLPTNTTSTTLTPSAATGDGVTLTASSTTGINGGEGFKSTDVGRLIRLKEGNTWGWVKITGFTSTTVVTVSVKSTLGSTGAKATWRLGVWSDTTGWPAAVVFHEDRLMFAGSTQYPQRIDGSNSSDYENFAPTDNDGTVKSSHAVSFSLNANDVNAIRWMASDEKGLAVGTVGGEWVVRAAAQNEALSPTNITAKPATTWGSADVQALQVGKASIFIQGAGRKVREMTYFFDVDGFRCEDLTKLAEHVTTSGIVQIAYQKEPQSLVWCVRADGQIGLMTYERDVDALRVGWSRQRIGGFSDAARSPAVVESVMVLPSADGTSEEVWLIVRRYIDGEVRRYVEYITKFFDDDVDQRDAFFVDSGLTYDRPLEVTGITSANPPVVTVAGHGLENGDKILLSDIVGMVPEEDEEDEFALCPLNGLFFTVANKTTDTFELAGQNASELTPWVSGGKVRKLVSTIAGLDHLEGEKVAILGDGAVQPRKVVQNGMVTLSTPAAVVHAGFPYNSDFKLLRIEAGAADGTALGKKRRTNEVGFLLHRTLGMKLGTTFSKLSPITFRKTSDRLGHAPELFTGVLSQAFSANYDFENQICGRQDQPTPGTILAVMPQMTTQDGG